MRALLIAALLFCGSGCGKKQDGKPVDVDFAPLAAKFERYKKQALTFLAPRKGWVSDECDDVKFTGIAAIWNPSVDLTAGMLGKGQWGRKRGENCYPKDSDSETSRDQVVGAGWWIRVNDRKDIAGDTLNYVEANGGILGAGDHFRTEMRGQLFATFLKLAGRRDIREHVPIAVSGAEKGYARETVAWHLELRADIEGGMREGYTNWLESNAREQPHNPLYQYMLARWVTGAWQPFVDAAMNEAYWPDAHLPTSQNYCETWVMQRDMGHDWEPCKDGVFKQWIAADWLAVVKRALDHAD